MGSIEKFIADNPIPEANGAKADLYKRVQELRYSCQKTIDKLKKYEKEIEDSIIDNLPKGDKGAVGERYRVQVTTKPVATVEDRDAFNAYVLENARLDLLSSSISQKAVKEMWEDDQQIPGVGKFNKVGLSFNKL